MKQKKMMILLAMAATLLLAPFALADNVTFDFQPLGDVYGGATGYSPGDYLFSEGGADLYIAEFFISGNPYFNYAQIDPAFAVFGNNQILEENNVTVVFDFSAPGNVTFEYLDMGGSVNLLVNGAGPVLEANDMADLVGVVAPGVTLNCTVVPASGGHKGVVTLTGAVQRLRLGGQEFWIDNVRNDGGETPGDCDYEVTHQTQPIGAIWGNGYGQAPGDFLFAEDGIPVLIDVFDWGSGVDFNFCEIQTPGFPGFGFDRVMWITNVTNRYEIHALGISVNRVTFEYADLGGMHNLQVNGATLHIGDIATMPFNVAPGVTMSVATYAAGAALRGEVTLTGHVDELLVGGQEFFVDNVCVYEGEPPAECDHLSDNESQIPGMAWGSSYGDSPGDWIFNEDGIDVGIELFDWGTGYGFNEASISTPWCPIGDGNALHLNNICATYDLSSLGPIAAVVFEFCKGGGMENLLVDGTLYVGNLENLPANFFPGVVATLDLNTGPGYIYGTVTLTGHMDKVWVGGQEFYIDNFCVYLASSPVPDVVGNLAKLEPNVPNPFNPSTTLKFSQARDGHVQLSIVDLAGRKIRTLVDEVRTAGEHAVLWDGRDSGGRQAPTGLYLVVLETGGEVVSRKIAMVK